jgi:predicted RNA-binding Zn ribbon-like protein
MPSSWNHTLAGGHPVLDFVNTLDDWTQPDALDYFETFADAVRFAEAVGMVSPSEAGALTRAARQSATGAKSTRSVATSAELTALRRLRTSLERIFKASIEGKPTPAADVAVVRRNFIEAARGTEFVASPGAPLARRIGVDANGPAALRLRVVDSAVALLQSEALRQVKVCPSCGWYFLDVSKNQSRVWCSMDSCGARAKAQRYYHRTKRRSSGSRPARSRS